MLLQIHLFGHLRLVWNNEPLPFKTLPKVSPLLAYLLLNKDTSLPRETLAFLFWSDSTEKQAKSNLRRHLYNLRQALPDTNTPWVLVTRQTVQWNPAGNYHLDTSAFQHLSQNPSRLTEATDLYTNHLLPHLDEPWLLPQRQRLRQQYNHILDQLIQQNQQNNLPQAIHYAQKRLDDDPFNEEALRQLLHLHHAQGDRATALRRYTQFKALLNDELGLEPTLPTTTLAQAIEQGSGISEQGSATVSQSPISNPQSPISNLPSPLRPLIGRQTELTSLINTLTRADNPGRVITLTGTGGTGKTRLAIALAHHLSQHHSHHYPDGIHFVSLAPLTRPGQLLPTIATTLNIKTNASLFDALRYQRLLLILDNFEHLLPAVTHLPPLLQAIPGLTLLTTSRIPLNLYGEHIYPVPPLPVPNTAKPDDRNESISLFLSVARSANPNFPVSPDALLAIADICRRLDGLPLAIELAAAWSRHLTPHQLLQQLQDSFHILTSRAHGVPDRHRTLQAAIRWSYDRLTPDEQRLFVGLSVFTDGFTPAGVAHTLYQQTPTDPDDIPPHILTPLTNLADHSLITPTQHTHVSGELRFTMLATLRQFAWEQADTITRHTLHQQHLSYYAWLAEKAKKVLEDTAPAGWLQRLQTEESNLHTALEWSLSDHASPALRHQGAQIILGLYTYWRWYARIQDGIHWTALALRHQDQFTPAIQIELLQDAAIWTQRGGDFDTSYQHFDTALRLAHRLEDPRALASTLNYYAIVSSRRGDFARARDLVRQTITIERDTHPHKLTPTLASAHLTLASIALSLNDPATARAQPIAASEAFLRDYGSDMTLYLLTLASIARQLGHTDQAAAYLREGFALAQARDNQYGLLLYLPAIAEFMEPAGQHQAAATLMTAFRTLCHQRNIGWPPRYQTRYDTATTTYRQNLDPITYAHATATGAAMTLKTATQFAEAKAFTHPH